MPGPGAGTPEALLRRLALARWWERLTTDPAPTTADDVDLLVDRVLLPVVLG